MLKQQPKKFWSMLKQRTNQQSKLSLDEFTEFNKAVFYNDKIPPDHYTPLTDATTQHITQEELANILTHGFKANKSSGLSKMPLELLKHLGPAGTGCMAKFLNDSAIDKLPPEAWRATKVMPLYKGKGDQKLPENYRSIAITPPFAKLFMAVVNKRLTTTAIELELHAPT